MIDWLRSLLMIFYAPVRGMREMRDRSLAPVAFIALASQVAFGLVAKRLAGASGIGLFSEVSHGVKVIAVVAMLFVPILILVANTFERRGSFRVVITQEYGPLAATVFYALTAANIFGILITLGLHYSGIQATQVMYMIQNSDRSRAMVPEAMQSAESAALFKDWVFLSYGLFAMTERGLFAIGTILAVKETFRMTAARAFVVTVISGFAAQFVYPIVFALFSGVLGSPFLLILLFLLLRGFFSDIIGSHRAKAAFRQNLESATLNPADASAHYNLGLIHQNRGELDQARERFERALQIDAEEIDASYQLGRIARQQKRYTDAIQNFEQVVMRNPAHSQHEVWREVAATYIAAGQFEDARTALDQFLEHRPSDPEGLYLMGRAHAGLGHKREAASLMQACIEAVKTAPAYKYRTSKRWLNEAQQFIKSSQ
ncbi:MAG TPA: tetratricopeptide repeat protein [Pyrinomonadaceae bacterium]|nr:tetratricopeptide repeat protein [Pyrinomonadaceae bacterium]